MRPAAGVLSSARRTGNGRGFSSWRVGGGAYAVYGSAARTSSGRSPCDAALNAGGPTRPGADVAAFGSRPAEYSCFMTHPVNRLGKERRADGLRPVLPAP